jgi:FixJ family two-component response regulator
MLWVAIVDDDTSHCRALARLLSASGMLTQTFPSAENFLVHAGEHDFDCLVLDIQLGGMSGFELQSRLQAAGSPPAIVFLTAHEEPETIARAAQCGCAYVRKTETGQVLLDAIRSAVARRPPYPKGQ